MDWEVKNSIEGQYKRGLSGSCVKIGKFLYGDHRSQKDVLFWVQNKNAIFGWVTPYLYTEPSLYDCWKVQRSKIFKQNSIILIRSSFIAFLVISGPLVLAGVGVAHMHAHV